MPKTESRKQKPVDVDTILSALESDDPDRLLAIAEEAHPGDIEQAFERLDDSDREDVLDRLPAAVLSEWADYLPAADVEHRLNSLPKGEQREVLDALSDDELVDLLQEMEEEDRPQYIELLPEEKRQVSEDLMQYPEETAGGRMTMRMATLGAEVTVKEALEELRGVKEEAELLSRIYVLDEERRILGKVRLRDLAFSTWDTPIRELMDSDQISVQAMEDQEDAAQMIARYDLMALPVVDEKDRLLGVITHDDALEILEAESTEDMEKISGIGGDRGDQAYLQTPVLAHFRRRFGWVLVLGFLALTSGLVLLKFEDVLKSFYLLALYFPMVVAAGGNTGAQSATMVIRAMALGEFDTKEFGRVIWKEMRIGVLLGALLGSCVALQIQFLLPEAFHPENVALPKVAFVVGIALTAQIFTSTLFGALLPILARAFRLDPAVVASPAITTIVDLSGSLIYFGIAKLLFF
ncbi:MAG: magnesium transporter [Verrucomicrobiales bacterium]|nr:magnesium transporter [Verrucomicrobiales bacterium]